jgi:hypothetical protein
MLTKNVGTTDAAIRALLGLALLGVAASFNARPLLALGAGLVALVFIGTALFRMCPLYTLLGSNTCPRDAQPHGR